MAAGTSKLSANHGDSLISFQSIGRSDFGGIGRVPAAGIEADRAVGKFIYQLNFIHLIDKKEKIKRLYFFIDK
jgi:hypothetical protein